MIMKGDASAALGELGAQYSMELIIGYFARSSRNYIGSVVKITPSSADDPTISPDERLRGRDFAENLPIRVLTRYGRCF